MEQEVAEGRLITTSDARIPVIHGQSSTFNAAKTQLHSLKPCSSFFGLPNVFSEVKKKKKKKKGALKRKHEILRQKVVHSSCPSSLMNRQGSSEQSMSHAKDYQRSTHSQE